MLRIAMIPMFDTKILSKSLLKRLSKRLSKTIYRPNMIVWSGAIIHPWSCYIKSVSEHI